MHPATATDYAQLTQRLTVSALDPSPAEAHGMLCGLISAGRDGAEAAWIGELLAGTDRDDLLARDCRRSLRDLAAHTRAQIEGPGPGFTPLLPADDRPLPARALALYDWSRGYLYGLGLAGLDADDLSEQTREVLADFAAITHLDLDALAEGEENEQALIELQEFIWVAVMLVYEERGRRGGGA